MIVFNTDNNVFHLFNDSISYILEITQKGFLQHLYYGERIDNFSDETLTWFLNDSFSKLYLDKNTKQECFYQDNFTYDHALTEVASHGGGDKRGAPIIIKQEDGINYTDFRYKSHRIYDGKPTLKELPSSHISSCQTLEITLKDDRKNVFLILSYTIGDYSGIVRNTTIINDCEKEIRIKRAYSTQLDLPADDYDFWHFNGTWANEMQRTVAPVKDGLTRIFSNHGRSSHEENPFFMLTKKDATEDYGEAYGFSFLYSGNFSADIFVDKWHSTRVMQGICDEDFEIILAKGEQFILPESLIFYSAKGMGELSRSIHDFVRNCILPEKFAKIPQKIFLNSWEGCYFDFDTKKICDLINSAKNWGVELFCLDDGWFTNRPDDLQGLGDWEIDTAKVDFDAICNCCRQNDITFGLWFEPEMVNPNSKIYKEHPEYSIGIPDEDIMMWRHQLALDMANPKVIDYVFEKMCAILDKYPIGYVKWDNNKTLTSMYSPSCTNQGESYHKNILGTYQLIRRLEARYPHILFEGCASGGGRFDYGMLNYFPQIQGSDELDPLVRLFMQYSYSYGYPYCTVGYHIGQYPITSFRTKAILALWGTYGLEINTNNHSEEARKEVESINKIYKKYHHSTIICGDLYRIFSPFDTNYMSMASVSKDKSQALLVFANIMKENPKYRFVKFGGLDPKKMYHNTYDDKIYNGDYYRKVGLNFSRGLTEFECFLVEINEVK